MTNVPPAGTGSNPKNSFPTPNGQSPSTNNPVGLAKGNPSQSTKNPVAGALNATQKAAIASIKIGSSSIILTLMIELLAVGVFTLIAGISNDVGNMVILFMVGMWFIFMITDSTVISKLGASLGHVAQGA